MVERIVRCPTCKKSVRYDVTNPFRPFCSSLCKSQDIIAWAQGQYHIPGPEAEDEENERKPEPRRSDDEQDDA